jgi:ADP-ribose pyrophosphatase
MSADVPEYEVLHQGRYVRLVRKNGWEFVERDGITGIVVVVAVTDDQRLLLVEQHRIPLDGRVIELPAGMVGDKGEDEPFEVGATRELEEETGWRAGHMDFLTCGPASPGRTRYYYHFYRARDLVRTGSGGGDEFEAITVHEAPLDDIDRWLAARAADGLHVDPKIYVGLYFLQREARG